MSEREEACRAYVALMDEIRSKGRPPHTDYWHQSIDEAEKRVRAAFSAADCAAAIRALRP